VCVEIVPDVGAERCRVVLDSCKLNERYKIVVSALSQGRDYTTFTTFTVDLSYVISLASVDSGTNFRVPRCKLTGTLVGGGVEPLMLLYHCPCLSNFCGQLDKFQGTPVPDDGDVS